MTRPDSVAVEISKPSIDIGIVTRRAQPMLAFYQHLLGLPHEATIPMPGGGTMHRLKVGGSVVKIIETEPAPPVDGVPGGIRAATGYRYWTIHVHRLEEAVAGIRSAGHRVLSGPRTIREGVTIALVEDPDGNWVELLEQA